MNAGRLRPALRYLGAAFDLGLSAGVVFGVTRVIHLSAASHYGAEKLYRLWLGRSVDAFLSSLALALGVALWIGLVLFFARLVTRSAARAAASLVVTLGFYGLAFAAVLRQFQNHFDDLFPTAYGQYPIRVGTVMRHFVLAEGLDALHSLSTAAHALRFWVLLLLLGVLIGLALQWLFLLPLRRRIHALDERPRPEPSLRRIHWRVIRRLVTGFAILFVAANRGLLALLPAPHLPPIVWISLDTLRADHLPLHGYPRDTAPRLSEFARDAVVFDHAVSPSPWTLPTHMSWFTGLWPSGHGLVDMDRSLAPSALTITELLANLGYRTAGVVSCYLLSPAYGFGQGFDRYRFRPNATAPTVTRTALDLLDGLGRDSFFLFVHFFDIHFPFEPPYAELLRFTDVETARRFGGKKWAHYHDYVADAMQMDDAEFAFQVDAYDAEILFTDRHVGMILDALKEKGAYDEALIVVTSDHGEEWKDHGFIGHSITLFEEVLHVPFLVKPPRSAGIAPARVPERVSTLDLARTTLRLIGLDLPPEAPSRDLAPLMRREAVGWNETALAETELWGARRIATYRHGFKRIEPFSYRFGDFSGEWPEQFFYLSLDPKEAHSLTGLPALAPFRLLLAADAEALRTSTPATPGPTQELTPEMKEKLRALGYVK